MNDDNNGGNVFRPSSAIDPVRLGALWQLAERIAGSSLVPESLRTEGRANDKKDLPWEQIVANVFAVVEQADRWNISPFALLSCAAIVHGKLGFEGKVIAAVLESLFHIKLFAYYQGDPQSDGLHIYLCDQELPDDVIKQLKPGYRHPRFKIMDGSVSEWKTTGAGTPWRPATFAKMLVYRGTREWARVYKAGAILGVLGDDELEAIEMTARSNSARSVQLEGRFGGGRGDGFRADAVKQIGQGTGDQPMAMVQQGSPEAQRTQAATDRPTPDPKAASAKPAHREAGAGGPASEDQGRPAENGAKSKPRFRLTGEQIFAYASSLARMQSEASIEKASAKFWSENGGPPADKTPEYDLCFAIYQKQMKRVKGEIEAAGLLDEIEGDIKKAMGA